jgi:hypothetical protein
VVEDQLPVEVSWVRFLAPIQMPFRFSFRVDDKAITVPYAPISDDIRRNSGYVDLRGWPDKAHDIAEGSDSPALRHLLVRAASAGSGIFTLGCDLGTHQEPNRTGTTARQFAGGYVQFASKHYDQTKPPSYAAFANAIVAGMKLRVGKDLWEINFVGQPVSFKFDNEPNGIFPSLMVWFFANARSPLAALQSRERLIRAIDETTTLPSAIEAFQQGKA